MSEINNTTFKLKIKQIEQDIDEYIKLIEEQLKKFENNSEKATETQTLNKIKENLTTAKSEASTLGCWTIGDTSKWAKQSNLYFKERMKTIDKKLSSCIDLEKKIGNNSLVKKAHSILQKLREFFSSIFSPKGLKRSIFIAEKSKAKMEALKNINTKRKIL